MERDEDVRVRCFLALDALRARYGNDLPFVGALSDGFVLGGKRVPFLNRQKGIQPDQVSALDQEVLDLATRWNRGTPEMAEYHYDYALIVAQPR